MKLTMICKECQSVDCGISDTGIKYCKSCGASGSYIIYDSGVES